jgi:hypothetical protein
MNQKTVGITVFWDVENRSFVERYTRSGNFQLRAGGSFETSVIFFQLRVQGVSIPELRNPNTAARTSYHTQARLLFPLWITIHVWLFILIVFWSVILVNTLSLVFMLCIFQQEHTDRQMECRSTNEKVQTNIHASGTSLDALGLYSASAVGAVNTFPAGDSTYSIGNTQLIMQVRWAIQLSRTMYGNPPSKFTDN